MFNFDAALNQIESERAAKAEAAAEQDKLIEGLHDQLISALESFVAMHELDVKAEKQSGKVVLDGGARGRVEVMADENKRFRVYSVGNVYTGGRVDHIGLDEKSTTKVLTKWMTGE